MLVRCVGCSLTHLILSLGVPLISTLAVQAQTPPPRNSAPPLFQQGRSENPVHDFPYLLGVGDRLRVDVFGVEKYTGEQLVLTDGTINLQGIGPVSVAGLTLPQTQTLIAQRYSSLLRQPIITITLIAPRPVQVAIAGEVVRPGSYNLSGTQQFSRLSQAILTAGGITQSADLALVQLRRDDPRQPVVTLNLEKLLDTGDLNQDPILRDGDSIFIPTLTTFEPSQVREMASSSLAAPPNQSIQVVVVGAVFRPGAYSLSQDGGLTDGGDGGNGLKIVKSNLPTLTRALQTAGGITNMADIRNIEVQRLTQTGVKTTKVNLWELLQSGDINQDLFLQQGDTVIVPSATEINPTELEELASASFSPATINVNVVGEIKQPGLVQVRPNTPLNQALLAAGGFDSIRSNRGTVELIRLNPNGSVTRRRIQVDFKLGNAQANNPVLHNNDVIIVNRSVVSRIADTTSSMLQPVDNAFTFYRLIESLIPKKNSD
ncbi:conserved exported hypothetical protein [Planktothrix serta PCC 8927]|uniref:Polysaccharide export protein n=1 Tax=Planktothrix serta PCC 8927 TaxID=671068 RepID=A0A7Z9BME2_9CYAN|nr:SLBB domain-containing protein [Planktothrix serta]VXD14003.1 conserved exported hypothetical protein [Planktothrix serta PCC 8927]